MVRCGHCGALQVNGNGYCWVCAAPLEPGAVRRRAGLPVSPAASPQSRRSTALILAAVAFLLLVCVGLVVAGFGLTALIRWE